LPLAKDALDNFQEKVGKKALDSTTFSKAICLPLYHGMPRHLALPIVFYLLLAGVLDLDRLDLQ
jgi:hypothetical protein